jgi:hypothetical protein
MEDNLKDKFEKGLMMNQWIWTGGYRILQETMAVGIQICDFSIFFQSWNLRCLLKSSGKLGEFYSSPRVDFQAKIMGFIWRR